MRLKKIPIRVGFKTLQWSQTLSYSVHNPSAIPTDLKFKVHPEVNRFFTVAIHPRISPRSFLMRLELITLSLFTLFCKLPPPPAHSSLFCCLSLLCPSEGRKRQRADVALFILYGVHSLGCSPCPYPFSSWSRSPLRTCFPEIVLRFIFSVSVRKTQKYESKSCFSWMGKCLEVLYSFLARLSQSIHSVGVQKGVHLNTGQAD